MKHVFRWTVDSGCTRNMCNDEMSFVNFRRRNDFDKVKVGNGKFLNVCGEGDVILNLESPSKSPITCRLRNVLFVPGLTHNLVSVSQILAGGKKVLFTEYSCEIENSKKTVAVGDKRGDLYILRQARSKENRFKENSGTPHPLALTAVKWEKTPLRKIRCRHDLCKHLSCR